MKKNNLLLALSCIVYINQINAQGIVVDNIKKKVLVEHFSTALCSTCPAAHDKWKNVLKQKDDVIQVTHHSGYQTDIYTISESVDYIWFYNSAGTVAPAAMIDRTNLSSQGAMTFGGGPVFGISTEADLSKFINYGLNIAAGISIFIESEYDETTKDLNIRISGTTLNTEDDVYLNVFITEDKLVSQQAGATSTIREYEHNHVLRKVLTNVWGDAVQFSDNKYLVEYNHKITENWKVGNLQLIAFLSNYNSSNVNNCKVINAESVAVGESSPTVSINNTQQFPASVYVKDKTVFIDGEYSIANIYNLTGKKVKQLNANNSSVELSRGIYIVEIIAGNRRSVRKVSL